MKGKQTEKLYVLIIRAHAATINNSQDGWKMERGAGILSGGARRRMHVSVREGNCSRIGAGCAGGEKVWTPRHARYKCRIYIEPVAPVV